VRGAARNCFSFGTPLPSGEGSSLRYLSPAKQSGDTPDNFHEEKEG
jgi:hypothetical protein